MDASQPLPQQQPATQPQQQPAAQPQQQPAAQPQQQPAAQPLRPATQMKVGPFPAKKHLSMLDPKSELWRSAPKSLAAPQHSAPKSLTSMSALNDILALKQMDINIDNKSSNISGCRCFDDDDNYDDMRDDDDYIDMRDDAYDDDDEGGLYGNYDEWEDYYDSVYN